ncbi:flagellar basal body P-ring formation chaperone FlgA [Jiella marina]|uniref:flagellar basal body P-ring formation chaperone FlgA n=1 Tax=Jiella sp. LLJ827 TaxID=2917712 RepID=UPI00210096B4|nr:flagellar basal body P-ring formation chaperone FlgA [Jiella sp. LLJ827]MCQ0988145.1 flagellar basal body P-ring formation chaperone FlgA [Jiella sp. LLJ827]
MMARSILLMAPGRIRRLVWGLAILAWAGQAVAAKAAELDMPVPVTVVYPGQNILERGVSTSAFIVKDDKVDLFALDESMLVGLVAKRTLLPGKAIRMSDVKLPDLVKAGAQVTLVYREAGLIITGLGTAMLAGAEGDLVKVRNRDSGIIVSGVVDADGTVRIEG